MFHRKKPMMLCCYTISSQPRVLAQQEAYPTGWFVVCSCPPPPHPPCEEVVKDFDNMATSSADASVELPSIQVFCSCYWFSCFLIYWFIQHRSTIPPQFFSSLLRIHPLPLPTLTSGHLSRDHGDPNRHRARHPQAAAPLSSSSPGPSGCVALHRGPVGHLGVAALGKDGQRNGQLFCLERAGKVAMDFDVFFLEVFP